MKLLSLTLPNGKIEVPSTIPTGGLEPGGAGHKIIAFGVSALILIAILATLFFLLSAGIDWIRSEGDKSAVEAARHKLIYAIIGLAVVFLSFLIVGVIGSFFGVNLISTPIGLLQGCTGATC